MSNDREQFITIQTKTDPETQKRPYPWHIDFDSGAVRDQDVWRGDPKQLIGFQADLDEMKVDLLHRNWRWEPETAVGMYPVLVDDQGGMFTIELPIESVTPHNVPDKAGIQAVFSMIARAGE